MKRPHITTKKLFLFLLSITALIVLFNIQYFHSDPIVVTSEVTRCHSTNQTTNETIKYIFDLTPWRNLLAVDKFAANKHKLAWCDVPTELQIIANALCRLYQLADCHQLPCQLVSSSPDTLVDISCLGDGRRMRIETNATENKSQFQCKRGVSLDLFIRDGSNVSSSSFPSLLADPFSPIDDDLYLNLLHKHYRSCNSVWAVLFNYESLPYYPWTGDRDKTKLFDVTFGYDRSVYDFTPDPWLFVYIEQIIGTTKRLSMGEAMRKKKVIKSKTETHVYWPETQTDQNEENQTTTTPSYIQSPILWMNSNCKTKSRRTQYVRELMHHIPIDNFGTCGINIRPLPDHIVRIQGSANHSLRNIAGYNWRAGKLALSADYLFTIAIENSLSHDYITEKLWQPLAAGSVPIYFGAPNVADWLPCRTECIIDLRRFRTVRDAALYIDHVAKNRTLYERFHRWRDEPLAEKFEKMLKYFAKMREYSVECVLCDTSRRIDRGEKVTEVKRKIRDAVGEF